MAKMYNRDLERRGLAKLHRANLLLEAAGRANNHEEFRYLFRKGRKVSNQGGQLLRRSRHET